MLVTRCSDESSENGETHCKCLGGQIQAHVRVSDNIDEAEVCFRLGKVLLAESPRDVVERT